MPRIKGRFAPLTEELGSDERFIVGCTDFEKLIYILIIYTTHMTHHQAPIDPLFYQHRYGIRARSHQLRHAIDTLLKRFPKLKCFNGKLSLLNSATYENEILPKGALEVEVEEEVEVEIEYTRAFVSFWNSYPKKKSKGNAYKAWKKINPSNGLFEKIMASVERAKKSPEWQKDGGQFIPYPASWLNAQGWEDDYDSARCETTAERIQRIADEAKQVPTVSKGRA